MGQQELRELLGLAVTVLFHRISFQIEIDEFEACFLLSDFPFDHARHDNFLSGSDCFDGSYEFIRLSSVDLPQS